MKLIRKITEKNTEIKMGIKIVGYQTNKQTIKYKNSNREIKAQKHVRDTENS